jgi:hypothetical protein
MTNSWKIRGNSCSPTQWLRQLAAIRGIRRTDVTLRKINVILMRSYMFSLCEPTLIVTNDTLMSH